MGVAFVIGLFGAMAAIVTGAAFLFLYYFMWRSEDRNELLHVVELDHPEMPITPSDAQQIAETAARHAVEAMVKESERNKPPIAELRKNAVDLARRLREFQRRHLEARYSLVNQFEQIHMLPAEQKKAFFTQYTTSQSSLSHAELFEFGPLRAEAINMRRDLLDALHEKFDPPKILANPQDFVVRMVLDQGGLAGPHPIYDVADYIESLAQRLKQ